MLDADLDRVRETAHRLRFALEPLWRAWRDKNGLPDRMPDVPLSYRMCRMSCWPVREILRLCHPTIRWDWAGGSPEPYCPGGPSLQGGYRTGDADWHGHHWVVGNRGAVLVDITADQFGDQPVRVLDPKSPDRDRYRGNFTPRELNNAMHNARFTGLIWTTACRPMFTGSNAAPRPSPANPG